ncbi:tetratricopeptide repeat protein, partial [Nonomuraea sp. NPDC050643]|uniref:CHAT domain-containing tetratricopeptide repeat protein n=1 Tax=Nonomuraea sp. NPDC050643 TaxID=3155660 RepID=UPI0033C27E21
MDIDADGRVSVAIWLAGEQFPRTAADPIEVAWPLDAQALEDLRWYLEDYLRHPFAVYSDRGDDIAAKLPAWGQSVFEAIFGSAPVQAAYATVRARGHPVEVVLQSKAAQRLGLPWELMRDPARGLPLVLDQVALTRSLPAADLSEAFPAGGARLRVLMVISRPAGERDVGYQMIARPLLERLEAVRGNVDLVVLRPPTLDRLRQVLDEAVAAGEPFQIVHFDGHGAFGGGRAPAPGWDPLRFQGPLPRGMLAFETPGGEPDLVPAERVAQVLSAGRVPVVVLNACQSGQVGGQVEAAVATRLVQGGAASVVAMAYSVYAVAAAEFMTAFYERLFAGDRVADAVTAGRARLALHDRRPSPKGPLSLADWMVPVHYLRRDVSFPGLRTDRRGASLEEMLDRLRTGPADAQRAADELTDDLAPDGVFVGRDGVFYTLEAAARLQRVVILHGPGGTGKTELAKAFGRWWRDTGGVERPDFVIWHSFEPGLPSFGLDEVITAIGRQVFDDDDFALADNDERRRIVRQLLAQRRLLLIWDNFESVHSMPDPSAATPPLAGPQLEELRRFLAGLARAGNSSVLITTRSPEPWLGEQLRRLEVGGLAQHEAIAYAGQLLQPYPNSRPRRQSPVFAELMEWLEGHPLAMKLTLPHLDSTDAGVLLAALRGTAPLPGRDDGGGGGGGGGDRATSLPACVAYSFIHLPADDRQALTALALMHGIADADVLAIMSQQPQVPAQFHGRSADDWDRVLKRASAVGLLTALGGGMYRIHPALPAYLTSRWRLDQPGDFDQQHTRTTRALLDAYAALSQWLDQQISGGNAQLAITVIGLQRRSLGSMLGHALDHQLWEHAQDIIQALNEYWDFRGLSEEAQGWTDRARLLLETPDGTAPGLNTDAGQLWLFILSSEANRQLRAHRLEEAQHTYLTLLTALQQQTPPTQGHIAAVHHQLGTVAQERGRLDEADAWYHQSLTIFEELGNRPGMANTYHQLGTVAQDRGRLDEADAWYHQSLTIEEELGNRPGMADSYHQLGTVALLRGRLDEADAWYRKSLTIFEELGNRPGMADSYHQLGTVALLRGRLDEADAWYRKSLTIFEELGNRPGMAGSYHQLGTVALLRGRLDEADAWYRKSLTIFEEL